MSLWLPQIVTLRDLSRPARRLSWPAAAAARFWSSRVIANQRSAGTFGACDRAIRQLVLQGLATVSTRTSAAGGSVDRLALSR